MLPHAKINGKKDSPTSVKVYLIRIEDGRYYYIAHALGYPNLKVAVTEKEVVAANVPGTIDEKAAFLAESRARAWVDNDRKNRLAINDLNHGTGKA